MRADAFRLPMAHPSDVSALEALVVQGSVAADSIVAIIGKTEGNGGVNDFTRGYFTQTLMGMLARHLGEPARLLLERIPCVLSGGTEGVLSPHYVVLTRTEESKREPGKTASLAVGTAMSHPVSPEDIGRSAHIHGVATAVRAAMHDARIDAARDVHFVQIKCPCITAARAEAAKARGKTVITSDSNRSMAIARAAGALGVALALGELEQPFDGEPALLQNFSLYSTRASVSSGIEVDRNEVIVLGNSRYWSGPLQIAHRPMRDALDIGAIVDVLHDLGIGALPQVGAEDRSRLRAVLVKCEPDRRGHIRGHRHTMLDDTDINAQRHVRGAVGGLVAGVVGDTRIFISGGAEHQGPDGGGLIAVIAQIASVG
jgi:cyanuric acid amidohydrolase